MADFKLLPPPPKPVSGFKMLPAPPPVMTPEFPVNVAPPKPMLDRAMDAAATGLNHVVHNPVVDPIMRKYNEQQAIYKANNVQGFGDSEPLLPDLTNKFEDTRHAITDLVAKHGGGFLAGAAADLPVELAEPVYNFLRSMTGASGPVAMAAPSKGAYTPEVITGKENLRAPGIGGWLNTKPAIAAAKPINIFQAPKYGYDITKNIPAVGTGIPRAEDTLLGSIVKNYENPSEVVQNYQTASKPVSGFQQYAQTDAAIQSELAAKRAAENAKFQNFLRPSNGTQVPATPFSTRMNFNPNTESPRVSAPAIPVGKDASIYTTVPESLYPRRAQSNMEAIVPDRFKVEIPSTEPVKPKIENWVMPEPPAAPKQSIPADLGDYVNTEKNRAGQVKVQSSTPYGTRGKIEPKYGANQIQVKAPEGAAPGALGKDLKSNNKNAFKTWSTKLQAANELRRMETEDWSHLPKGVEAIDKYQKGDRATPGFDKVEKLMSDLYDKEKAAGLDVGKKDNYLRQFWKQPEGTIPSATTVPKTPGFAKESTFETYAEGRASGKEMRFENMNDIVAHRIAEHKRALANKELYDYLEKTGQLSQRANGTTVSIRQPSSWSFTGPESKQLTQFARNVLQSGKDTPAIGTTAEVQGRLKNVYLLGGIPKTPLNIHGYNIARSEYRARGMKGLLDFARGVVNPANDTRTIARLRPLIKEALDYGYTGVTEANVDSELTKALAKTAPGRVYNKFEGKMEDWFESPLFKKRLPAAKALVLEDQMKRLTAQGVPRAEALQRAVDISTDFMGGINKSLRNKTYQNLAQIGFLAPDWAESRIRLGAKSVKGIFGKGADASVYRAGALRAGALRGAGAALGAGLGYEKLSKSGNAASEVSLGKTKSGSERSLQTYGTSSEEFRIPENIIAGYQQGDYKPILNLVKNRLSTPTKAAINLLVTHEDDMGRPLVGKDRFGKDIPRQKAAINILKQLAAPVTYQSVQALLDYADGQQGAEESLAQALELPLSYRYVSKKGATFGGK